jgi:hypothetical protein
MRALLPRLMSDAVLRVPLTRFDDAGARAAHERAVKARLVEAVEGASFAELIAGAAPEDIEPAGEAAE